MKIANKFKIRASQTVNIISEPTNKIDRAAGKISEEAKSYCKTWLKTQPEFYDRKKEFSNKYTEKGNIVEDESIEFIAKQLNLGFVVKNEQHFKDETKTGTPDILLPKMIIDAKNSWDFDTFPLFKDQLPAVYWWQGQSYLALTGRDHYKVVYVLSDTPVHLIHKEALYWCLNNGYEDLDTGVYKDFLFQHTYNEVSDNLKIKVFEFDRDPAAITHIETQVYKCRNYIEELLKVEQNKIINVQSFYKVV
jgi:hypothetical protein